MTRKRTIRDVDWQGKRALVRVDFNVPVDKNGRIADDTRIRATLPTVEFMRKHGASLVLMSHLGRPNGQPDPRYSLQPIAQRLSQLLNTEVRFPAP